MQGLKLWIAGVTLAMSCANGVQADEPVELFAAGSLRAALSDVADAFTNTHGVTVERTFGPSGLLRQRIESGEPAQVFASANMGHPRTLAEAGIGGPTALFARNRLCGLAQPQLTVTTDTFLQVLLDETVRVGTSTPVADPSGDYAWELFRRADAIESGAFDVLDAKALQLTGGPDSPAAPEGRNPYAWVMTEDRADLFLTYCTNAVLARRDTPELQLIRIPEALGVGADYGLSILAPDRPDAVRLALFILSPAGQEILADYGFEAPGRIVTGER